MVAMGVDAASGAPPATTSGAPEAQRQARYNYLVGRLRARQVTMEEATELFGLMQAAIRSSEVARRALTLAAGAAAPQAGGGFVAPRVAAAPSGSDDLFLIGLLAMGAGAGLLAAMAQRIAAGPAAPAQSDKGSTARRDA